MTEIYLEWINKAEGDYHTALRDFRARKYPNYDSACFHAQQCIEKYFKAILQKENLYFPKTPDLNVLLELFLPTYHLWEVHRNDLKILSIFAMEFRYPGEIATKEETQEDIRIMKRIREKFKSLIYLSSEKS